MGTIFECTDWRQVNYSRRADFTTGTKRNEFRSSGTVVTRLGFFAATITTDTLEDFLIAARV